MEWRHLQEQSSYFPADNTDVAPHRVQPATWTTGAKEGVGTAYYSPEEGSGIPSQSNIWFTLACGVLTEVYYPDVSHANLKTLELVVTDGESFTDTESENTIHECEIVTTDALIYRQINTAKNGKYRIEKTYVTNPHAHSVLCDVKFHALIGNIEDYQLYIYAQPIVSNGPNDDTAMIEKSDRTYLVACDASAALAVTTTVPFCMASVGQVGVSDGMEDLKSKFQLINSYDKAPHGPVALVGKLSLSATASVGAATATLAESEIGAMREKVASFTVVVGFGNTVKEAIRSTNQTVNRPFHHIANDYCLGWRTYLNRLSFPQTGSQHQFRIAAMTLKAHEDKIHPGAIVASLSVPWGDSVIADEQTVGGYHLVWPRDLYHVATALAAIGDTATARRALDYLENVLQQVDGSFPQNTWLDGTPYWTGLQLDQVAFPILLAGQLQETGQSNRYSTLVKPAADFIVRNGPQTEQERWEENSGFSPSTIAAEIAGLVVAAKMARQSCDYTSAAIYLHTADEWANMVDEWTSTKSPNSSRPTKPSYIRISDSKNADDGHWIELRNGGGWHPKAEIFDGGFLELVRLGIKPADDELMTNSLDIIDRTIRYTAPYGPLWYRYNFDGYGEPDAEGSYPIHVHGVGRPWPLLTGERGEYEVALLCLSEKRSTPANIFGPETLLETMGESANCGGMIPEQVWDGPAQPSRNLMRGMGTGSATPLAWAMAQYLRLGACISEGRIVEMPTVVSDRYCGKSTRRKLEVSVESPVDGEIITNSHLQVSGRTLPSVTVLIKYCDVVISVEADLNGHFCVFLTLIEPGLQKFLVIVYDNEHTISECQVDFCFKPPILFEMENTGFDNVGDPQNARLIQYPTSDVFAPGDFDLQKLIISADDENTYFQIQLGHLDNPWNGPSGISKQVIDIYIDTHDAEVRAESSRKECPAQRLTLGLGAEFAAEFGAGIRSGIEAKADDEIGTEPDAGIDVRHGAGPGTGAEAGHSSRHSPGHSSGHGVGPGVGLGWTKLIRITGNWFGDAHVYNHDWSNGGPIQIFAHYETGTLAVRVSNSQLGGSPKHGWMLMAVVAGEHYGGLRPIHKQPSEWTFGYSGMSKDTSDEMSSEKSNVTGNEMSNDLSKPSSYIVELLVPAGETRRRILSSGKNGVTQLPMIRI
jgi:glucan 1,4-alpha-glucosidase